MSKSKDSDTIPLNDETINIINIPNRGCWFGHRFFYKVKINIICPSFKISICYWYRNSDNIPSWRVIEISTFIT